MSGSLAHSPSRITQQLLVNLSLGTLDPAGSWPVTRSKQLGGTGDADDVIFVGGTEGLLLGRNMLNGCVFEKYGISILVRAAVYDTGEAKARAITLALDGVVMRSVTISGTTYVYALFQRTGGVIDVGEERGTSRQLFSVNGYATIRQLA